jgi:hypothetical protein
MPKPVPLTPDALTAPQITPQAATPQRSARSRRQAKQPKQPPPKPVPLQVRLPREEVRAIKIAATQRDQTISQFMLTCFHAYIKNT